MRRTPVDGERQVSGAAEHRIPQVRGTVVDRILKPRPPIIGAVLQVRSTVESALPKIGVPTVHGISQVRVPVIGAVAQIRGALPRAGTQINVPLIHAPHQARISTPDAFAQASPRTVHRIAQKRLTVVHRTVKQGIGPINGAGKTRLVAVRAPPKIRARTPIRLGEIHGVEKDSPRKIKPQVRPQPGGDFIRVRGRIRGGQPAIGRLPAHPVVNLSQDAPTHLRLSRQLGFLSPEPARLLRGQTLRLIAHKPLIVVGELERGTNIGAQGGDNRLRLAAPVLLRVGLIGEPVISQLHEGERPTQPDNRLRAAQKSEGSRVPVMPLLVAHRKVRSCSGARARRGRRNRVHDGVFFR